MSHPLLTPIDNGESPSWFAERMFGDADEGRVALFLQEAKWTGRFNPCDAKAIDQLIADQRDHYTIYFGVGLQTLDLSRKRRGKKEEIYSINFVWADLDFAKPDSGKTYATPSHCVVALDSMPLRPSLVIFSGRGLYPIWQLEEPVILNNDVEAAREFERLYSRPWQQMLRQKLRVLNRTYSLDATADVTRGLRVPGSQHRKCNHTVCVTLDTGALYTLEDIEPYTLPLAGERPCRQAVTVDVNHKALADDVDQDHLEALLANDETFRRTWERQRDDLKDQSPSEYEYAIANLGVGLDWSDQKIAAWMYAWRMKHSALATWRPDRRSGRSPTLDALTESQNDS